MAESNTKRILSQTQITQIIADAFGSHAQVDEVSDLTDGMYNASYKIKILHQNDPQNDHQNTRQNKDTTKTVVLKVAPATNVEVMTYEKDVMKSEYVVNQILRKEPSVPTPAILYHNFDKTIIDSDILIFECLQGQPLHNMKQEHANSFLEVQEPVLNHFDVWDGNVFVMQDGENCSVEAIIDCERAFYEDPLCDLISSVNLLGDIRTEKEFLSGYYGTDQGAMQDISFSHSQLFRLYMYKLYLYLIMLVETAYRDSGSWLYKRFIRHHIRSGYGQARRYGEMVRA